MLPTYEPPAEAPIQAPRLTIGLRIDPEVEHGELDLHEHGTVAYPEFVPFASVTSAAFAFTTTSGDGAISHPPVPILSPRPSTTAPPAPRAPRPRVPLDQPWLATPPTWGAVEGKDVPFKSATHPASGARG